MAMFMQRAEHTAFPNISKKITFGADTAINDTEATLTIVPKTVCGRENLTRAGAEGS
jgi:hypothetical protein